MSETFLIKKTTFNVAGTVADREINSFIIGPGELNGPAGQARDSDLKLYGFGSLKWGEGVNQDLYRLLENNACPAKELGDWLPGSTQALEDFVPRKPGVVDIPGNGEYDPSADPILPKDENDLGVGNGITTPLLGQHWFNTSNDIIYSYTATGWGTAFNADGSLTITGQLDMGNNRIINLKNPVDPTDALNLQTGDSNYVNLTGGTMTGTLIMSAAINANSNIVMGAGSTIDMGNNQITNLTNPVNPTDALNLQSGDSKYINVTGDTMTGVLAMGDSIDMSTTNSVINLAEPAAAQDAATKNYVDTELNTVAVGFMPIGSVMAFAGTAAPSGWFKCNGFAPLRTVYAELFLVLGTTYGAGDGSTTFNLPDYRGEFLRGYDDGAGIDPDAASRTDRGDGTVGDVVGSKQSHELNSHEHLVTAAGVPQGSSGTGASSLHQGGSTSSRNSNSTGGNETRPRNVNVMYIIYAGV